MGSEWQKGGVIGKEGTGWWEDEGKTVCQFIDRTSTRRAAGAALRAQEAALLM